MLTAIAASVVAGWLPGAVLFRLPWADRPRRAALDSEERLFWAVMVSVAVSLSVAFALAWLGRYTLRNLLLVDGSIALAAAAGARFDLRLGAAARGLRWTALIPLGIVVLGVWRFFPPAEYIIGGRDPGVYINAGVQIAQRGTFLYEDPLVREVPPFARDLFFPSHAREDYFSNRFMGFRIIDPDRGLVVSQFPHLYPASIAIAYDIAGLTGARNASSLWAILGLLAVYFTGSRLFGRAAASSAAVLLALNLIQVWFARYPNSEVVMQAMLFTALLAASRAQVDGDRFFAPIAGVLLGLLLFLRMDGVLGIAGVLAGAVALAITGRRLPWLLPATLTGVSGVAAIYLAGPMRAYVDRGLVFASTLVWWQIGLMVLAGVAAGLCAVAASRLPRVSSGVRTLLPLALAVGLAAAAVYAQFVREPGGRLADYDAFALRTFTAYYFTLPALIAAIAGFLLASRSVFWRAPAFFLTFAVFACFFFYKLRIVPDHFWMARRFLPMILPGALLFVAAAALGWRDGRLLTRLPRLALGLVFLTLVGVAYARASAAVVEHVEFAGVIPRLEQLAASIGERDLLIVESRDAGTDVHALATPLAYIYARHVLVLNSAAPDKSAFAAFLHWASSRYTRILFLGAGGTDLLSRDWGARVVAEARYQVPEFDAPHNEFPRRPYAKQFDYTIYALEAGGEQRPALDVDIGTSDDLHVLRFYAKEETEGRTFRWSQDQSWIVLPDLPPSSRTIELWMSNGGRPDAAPPATVTIAIDDTVLGTVAVAAGFRPYSLAIPAAVAERASAADQSTRLRITTPTWVPARVLGTGDDRELGVMIDRVTVK